MKSYILWGSYIWWMLQLHDKDFEIELIGLKLSSLMYFSDLFCGWFFFSFWFHDLSLVEPFIIINKGF